MLVRCRQHHIRSTPAPCLPALTHPNPTPRPGRRSTLLYGGILSQTEALTFILFWTLSNNIVHLF